MLLLKVLGGTLLTFGVVIPTAKLVNTLSDRKPALALAAFLAAVALYIGVVYGYAAVVG